MTPPGYFLKRRPSGLISVNRGSAASLRDAIANYRRTLGSIHDGDDDNDGDRECFCQFDGATHKNLRAALRAFNAHRSVVNEPVVDQLIQLFELLCNLHQRNQDIQAQPQQPYSGLYGAIKCALNVSHAKYGSAIYVAQHLETLGRAFPPPDEAELRAVPVVELWDVLADLCLEIVTFCTRMLLLMRDREKADAIFELNKLDTPIVMPQLYQRLGDLREQYPVKTFKPGSEEYTAVLNWLLPNDPLDTYRDILSRRRGEGTGRWLLEDPKFAGWLSKADETLWCPGIAGAGKTMLATIVMEHLFNLHKESKGTVGIACVYLSHKEGQPLERLLLSILKQLIQYRKIVSEKVIDTYELCAVDKTRPEKIQILEMLQGEVDSFTDTFVVIDALDECSHGVRVALINGLEKLQPKIHLLVTSRQFEIITDMLKESVTLEISARPQDIRAFIKAQINDPENYRLKEFVTLEPKLKKEIEDAIISTAKGMFLLARLYIESLASALNLYEVRKALTSLPATVDDTYALALARIENQPLKGHRDFSHKVLCWVAYSLRPLTVNELLCALAVDPEEPAFNAAKVALKRDVTDLCAGLVIIDQISDVVRLVHPTMQTYFNLLAVRNDPRFAGTRSVMADTCLTCLSFGKSDGQDSSDDDSDDGSDDDGLPGAIPPKVLPSVGGYDSDDGAVPHRPRAYSTANLHYLGSDGSHSLVGSISAPAQANASDSSNDSQSATLDQDGSFSHLSEALNDYAVRFWGSHARKDSEQSETCSTTLYATAFLCDDVRRQALVQHMCSIGMFKTKYNVTGLHVAAKLGLTELAKALLAKGCDVGAQDRFGNSPLAIAIESNHEDLMILLVDAGATVDLLQPSGQTVLIAAAERGLELLANRIFQKAGAAAPQITLLAAAYDGRGPALDQILGHPDLDLMGRHASFGVAALLLSAERGNYDAVRTLVNRGIDAAASGGSGDAPPALHRAAGRGHTKIVKFLIKNKELLNSRDRDGLTAWTYSVRKHQRQVSAILLKAGADPNAKGSLGLTELYHRAAWGAIEDVKFLLESGTDPSIQTDFGWAPLHWAADLGHYEVVKLLLKYGANPSPLSDTGLTPLDKAREAGRWKVVELLEKAGALSGRDVQASHHDSEDSSATSDSNVDDDENESQEPDQGPRIVCYYQTQFLPNGDFVSVLPLATEATGATHVILAAIHLNDGPGNIHLNDDPPSNPKFDGMWKELQALQDAGIKVLGMLGGAAAGSFARLDGQDFEAYYEPLRDLLKVRGLDGLDLDVEERMSLAGIERLISRLKADFGAAFLVTLAPVAPALRGGGNLSGFDYRALEDSSGAQIAWYNAQFYCGWGSAGTTDDYTAIIDAGWPAHKVVLGLITNPANCSGWVDLDVLERVLPALRKAYPDFGGVMGWEYFNSLPGGEKSPWEWAQTMGRTLDIEESD